MGFFFHAGNLLLLVLDKTRVFSCWNVTDLSYS